MKGLLEKTDIKSLYKRRAGFKALQYSYLPHNGVRAVNLPSTNSANASWSFERLKEKWAEEINRAY